VSIADELGVNYDKVLYLKHPPDRETLTWIVEHLEDPVADLVRKDSTFAKLGLDEADYREAGPVVELLLEHPKLLQRPVIVKGDLAIIGRPKERVRQLLEA
jgi:arsenate reductase